MINETKWGLPIFNQKTVFANGLWAPAPSTLTYKLDGGYKKFTAQILVSAFAGVKQQVEVLEKELRKSGNGTVQFRVSGDGRVLFESKVLSYASGATPIEVDVTDVKVLVLEVLEADGSNLLDFSVWADGKLHM